VTSTVESVSPRESRASAAVLVREHAWPIAIWAAMGAWTVVLCAVVYDAFSNFRLGRFDLGNMVQAVWSTAEGRPLETTNSADGEQIVRLGGHADPFLVLLTPVWSVWPSPLSLAFAQVAVVALGALPVFWLARRHLHDEGIAGVLALAYLAYPWVATSAVSSIHPVTFAITFFLFCIWCLDTDRLVAFAVFAGLAMSTGELMGLPVAALGIWFALARGRRLAGAVIALAGLAWSVFAVYVVVPAYSPEGDSMFFGFYDEVGGSPQGVIRMLLSDPGVVLGALFEGHDIVYLVWLGLPLLFLFVLTPGLALVALPQLLANWLSDFRSMSDPRYHSLAAVVPFLIAATVFSVAKIGLPRRTLAAAAILVCSATLTLAVGPWARAVGSTPLGGRERVPEARAEALAAAVRVVPDGVAVTASNTAGGHLSDRQYIYSVPNLGRATWVVVDTADPWVVTPDSPLLSRRPKVVRAFAARIEADPGWERVFAREGVLVFRRS
jgi:uncharacterized membrane protein